MFYPPNVEIIEYNESDYGISSFIVDEHLRQIQNLMDFSEGVFC